MKDKELDMALYHLRCALDDLENGYENISNYHTRELVKLKCLELSEFIWILPVNKT